MTLVGFYVIPVTLRLVLGGKKSSSEQEPTSSTKESQAKIRRIRTLQGSKNTKLSKIVLLSVLWSIFGWALFSAWRAKVNFKAYDPFEILGVEHGSNDEQIKSAFKKLSRLYHPDKAKAEERDEAERKFVHISKAYKALTDEKIRKNWEEHGNPDGIRTFALGVALPSWMVNSGNRIILLVLYCIAFGVGLPLLVKQWWGKSKRYTKDGLRHSSMALFFHELKENSSAKKILEMLASASEFQEEMIDAIKVEPSKIKELLKFLEERVDPSGDHYEQPKKLANQYASLAHALLYCHFHRVPVEDESLAQAQRFVVPKCVQLLQGIIQIAVARQWLHPALHCMNISQSLVQGLWDRDLAVLQLPFVTSEIAKHCTSGKKQARSIADVLDMPEVDRQKLFRTLAKEELSEMLEIAQTFPLVKIDAVNFRILGQEVITPGGLITCQVRLSIEYPTISTAVGTMESGKSSPTTSDLDEEVQTFEFDEDGNLLDDPSKKLSRFTTANIKPIYCPRFPSIKRPNWWVTLVNKNNTNFVATPVKVSDLVDSKTVVLQLPAPPRPMPVSLLLVVKSDCLIGVDLVQEVKFTVMPTTDNTPVERWDISGDEEEQLVKFDD